MLTRITQLVNKLSSSLSPIALDMEFKVALADLQNDVTRAVDDAWHTGRAAGIEEIEELNAAILKRQSKWQRIKNILLNR